MHTDCANILSLDFSISAKPCFSHHQSYIATSFLVQNDFSCLFQELFYVPFIHYNISPINETSCLHCGLEPGHHATKEVITYVEKL